MFVSETSTMNNYCKLIPTLLSRNQAKNRSILSLIVLYIYGVEKKKSQFIQSKEFFIVAFVCFVFNNKHLRYLSLFAKRTVIISFIRRSS